MINNDNWGNNRAVTEGRNALERTSASLARSQQYAIESETIGTEVKISKSLDELSC